VQKRSRCIDGLALAVVCVAFAGAAGAVSFGPFAVAGLVDPQVGPSQVIAGELSLELGVFPIPFGSTVALAIRDLALTSGSATFTLDPALSSPASGALFSPSNEFLIPTLFLRIGDGASSFDLAIPNVTGFVLRSESEVYGLVMSPFQIDAGGPAGILTIEISAGVPEPGTALLLTLGLGALAARARKEIAR